MTVGRAILVAVGFALVLVTGWELGRERTSAAKATEAKKLLAAGYTLASELARLEVPKPIEKAVSAMPGAPVAVRSITTCQAPVTRTIHTGERLRLHIDEADVRTHEGNQVLIAKATITDDQGHEVARAAIDPALSSESVATMRDERVPGGWGIGPAVTLSSRGLAYGVTAASPPASVFGVELTPVAAATFGEGVTGVTLGVFARWGR